MPGKSIPVVPSTNRASNYTNDQLGSPEVDMDQMIDGSVETRFGMNACLVEGCSGRLDIDTTFENTSEVTMDVVRSDVTRYEDLPAPRDTIRHKYPHRLY